MTQNFNVIRVTSCLLIVATFTRFSLLLLGSDYELLLQSLTLLGSQNQLFGPYRFLHRAQSYGVRQISLLLFSAINLMLMPLVSTKNFPKS